MAATIWEKNDNKIPSFQIKHGKHVDHTMIMVWIMQNLVIMLWILATMSRTWSPYCNYGMILTIFRYDHGMAAMFSQPGQAKFIKWYWTIWIPLLVLATAGNISCLFSWIKAANYGKRINQIEEAFIRGGFLIKGNFHSRKHDSCSTEAA